MAILWVFHCVSPPDGSSRRTNAGHNSGTPSNALVVCGTERRHDDEGPARNVASIVNQENCTVLRTHTCGELRKSHAGQQVKLSGWVDKYRDHAGIVFIDLRDRYGKTQIKFNLEDGSDIQKSARSLRHEDVVTVTGEVVAH